MKNFFTIIPLQTNDGLKASNYEAKGNSCLDMEKETRFPIIQVMNGYVKKDDEISVVAIRNEGDASAVNSAFFEEELKELSKSKQFSYKLNYVDIEKDQSPDSQMKTFQKIIEFTNDQDDIFACLTFGTKIQSMTLKTAIHYANKIKFNTFVNCVAYGMLDREANKSYIYDVTSIIKLEDIITTLAENKVSNPDAVIKNLLEM